MSKFLETGMPRISIHSGHIESHSIDERAGRHCIKTPEPLSAMSEEQVLGYTEALRRLNVPETDIERQVKCLLDPKARAERDQKRHTVVAESLVKDEYLLEMSKTAVDAAVTISEAIDHHELVFDGLSEPTIVISAIKS